MAVSSSHMPLGLNLKLSQMSSVTHNLDFLRRFSRDPSQTLGWERRFIAKPTFTRIQQLIL